MNILDCVSHASLLLHRENSVFWTIISYAVSQILSPCVCLPFVLFSLFISIIYCFLLFHNFSPFVFSLTLLAQKIIIFRTAPSSWFAHSPGLFLYSLCCYNFLPCSCSFYTFLWNIGICLPYCSVSHLECDLHTC